MHAMTHDEAVNVYCAAIDATVIGDAAWWRDVVTEVREVCAAPSLKAAAAVIEWWHHDWSSAGDTAAAAARRIRQAAQAIKREDHARV